MDISLCCCAVWPCGWSRSHPPVPSVSLASLSAFFTAYPHPQQPPSLLLTLVPHVHSPALCLTSWHLPYCLAAYLLLLPPHTFHLPPFFPPILFLSDAIGQRGTPCLTCYAAGSQWKCGCYPQGCMVKKNLCDTREKGMLVCPLPLFAAAWFFLPLNDELRNCKWCRLYPTFRRFLYCFHTKSLCKRDFGCTSTDADQLNDSCVVCRWWSQSHNRKISYSTRCLYLGSNCYSVPLYAHKLLKQ